MLQYVTENLRVRKHRTKKQGDQGYGTKNGTEPASLKKTDTVFLLTGCAAADRIAVKGGRCHQHSGGQ